MSVKILAGAASRTGGHNGEGAGRGGANTQKGRGRGVTKHQAAPSATRPIHGYEGLAVAVVAVTVSPTFTF